MKTKDLRRKKRFGEGKNINISVMDVSFHFYVVFATPVQTSV